MAEELALNAEVTLKEQISCIERELKFRGNLYARWVDRGKMTPYKATYELRAMGAVLQTLEKLHEECSTGNKVNG